MPIYEYVCRDCGHELEQLQRMTDDALTDCPSCGHAALKRKVSAAGFRLSGGGWYETDFKSDGQRNLAASDTKSDASNASAKNESKSSDASTDAKPGKKKAGDTAPAAKSGGNDTKKTGAQKADKKAGSKSAST